MLTQISVLLVPFLLQSLGYVSDDAEPWVDGGEVTYSVSMNIASDRERTGQHDAAYVSSSLKCREAEGRNLTCYLTNTTCNATDSQLEEYVRSKADSMTSPFRMSFDERGVKALTVSSGMDYVQLMVYKVIAELFHVGVDLDRVDGSPPLEFVASENTTFGLCSTKFKITEQLVPTPLRIFNPNVYNFELDRTSNLRRYQRHTVLDIGKIREADKCTNTVELLKIRKRRLETELIEPCTTHMRIGPETFRSDRTVRYSYVTDYERVQDITKIDLYSSLTLTGINRAEGPLPPIAEETAVDLTENSLQYLIL